MRLEISTSDDAVYIRFSAAKIDNTKRVRSGENHDFDAQGNLVGVEVIGASTRFGDLNKLTLEAALSKLNLRQSAAA